MKTKMNLLKKGLKAFSLKALLPAVLMVFLIGIATTPASAHCDSYDGPTVQDAVKALETNNVDLILKWIDKSQEAEVVPLFNKTYNLRGGDQEIYKIVEKHFLETLVRLHRETEGAPFTGLKPAGTTKPIIMLSDQAISQKDVDGLLGKLNAHIGSMIHEKYEKVAQLDKVKNESPEKGREYVEAYVDYTHTLEALHDIADGGAAHHH